MTEAWAGTDTTENDPTARRGRAARRRARHRTRRRGLRILGWTLAVVLVVTGGGAVYVYLQLAGNIRTAAAYDGSDKAAAVGVEKADPFGRTPLNIMLIGSDTRSTAEDCRLGGACGSAEGARADVEMLVHLSADRSNISVMSIPRDLMTDLPACTDPVTRTSTPGGFGQINSTLQYGPGCTDTAVHKLTGIPVDGFAMVDFGGVVDISNALGGVRMCFTSRLYDKNSGLKLTAGYHVLQGVSALQFLRTRDSFGDGSDNVGRTSATHLFFTAVIAKLKSAGTVTDLPAMYTIANAATKSLTVSDNLDSPLKLVQYAGELNKVPASRITFTTMQNMSDPAPGMSGRVLPGPNASALFQTIADDQPLSTAPGAAAPGAGTKSPGPAATVQRSAVAVSVVNGSGITGRAGAVVAALEGDGFSHRSSAATGPTPATTSSLSYGPGQSAAAQAVATALGLPARDLRSAAVNGLTLVIGADWTTGTTFPAAPGSGSAPAPVDTTTALDGTLTHNAAQDTTCVPVSTDYTQPGHTPQTMYDDNPGVPNSAP